MNTPRYAAAAARLLAKHAPQPPAALVERERSVRTIERAIRARTRRRQLAFLAGGVALVAATAALWLAPSRQSDERMVQISASPARKGAAIFTGNTAQPVSSDVALQNGQRLDTPIDGGATLRLSTGTAMELSGDTSFGVQSHGPSQRFSLARGELSAHVAKLNGGEHFIVDTPDAQIEVRGTRFRLRVLPRAASCGGGSRTRLDVTEGVVEVRAAGRIDSIVAGAHWPGDCAERPVEAAPPPGTQSPSARPSAAVEVATNPEPSPAVDRGSALARQNDLFAEGVARRRQGDVGGALRAYEQLIVRFPASPLAENAMLERMRLLAGQSEARARDEARRYLKRYPQGFGATEAHRLASER